ncbi:DapH/DapD/GlmU-related protein [Marinoscillum sp.]|uniref:DapH/DapD/GlmU-related protein n=1 Tax=Marinoscillum sp. TaxID=2024838 RepID=UPI003BAC34C0
MVSISNQQPPKNDIFERLRSGESIPMDDPDYGAIREVVNRTMKLSQKLNCSEDVDEVRRHLSAITGQQIDKSTVVFIPFHTNVGINIRLGKNVFINHECSFLDIGGITIEDEVMVGPRVNISSENHPTEIATRKTMVPAKVLIKRNAWIGAGATILPGVTIGENSVIAAGAVVTKDVPDNVLVGGVPAKLIKSLV